MLDGSNGLMVPTTPICWASETHPVGSAAAVALGTGARFQRHILPRTSVVAWLGLALVSFSTGSSAGAQLRSRPQIGNGIAHARATLRAVSVSDRRATMLVTLAVDPGWHVSWRNPGETGLPTRLAWRLPSGVRVRRETWPVPVIARTDVGATHTLEGEIPWLVEFTLDDGAVADRAVQLTIRYGVCRDVCIPEQLTVSGVVPGRPSLALAPVPAVLRQRLVTDHPPIAARRRVPAELCLERLPPGIGGTGFEIVADSGRDLDAALPVAARGEGASGPTRVSLPAGGVLRIAVDTVLLVQGARGVSVPLDFRAPAPRCGARQGPA